MGTGTSTDYWNGYDGVRITVVDAETREAVSTPMDFSNGTQSGTLLHFGKVNKLQYLSGTPLTLQSGVAYQYYKPAHDMPRIVGGSRGYNIEAIRRYFCSEYAAMLVAGTAGIEYELFVSGQYKLLLEPIAYFTHNSRHFCMTATEAALYDQLAGGSLRAKMPSLSHKNLPLAMFLEYPDLGLPAYSGSTSARQSNETIITSLGMGIISYTDAPHEQLEPGEADYEYRVNTEVITSVTLNAFGEINPDSPATVTFYISGRIYTVSSIVIPADGSQLVWVKWTTPASEQIVTITVSTSRGYLIENTVTAKIVDLSRSPPPDPVATDRNDGFTAPSPPVKPQCTSSAWSVWWARWRANWQWESNWQWVSDWVFIIDERGGGNWYDYGDWYDFGSWVDNGWYEFFTDEYSASLNAASMITPDDKAPSASGKLMKSGYGINNTVTANLTTNAPGSHVAAVQTAVSYFPEFAYMTYWRLLERTSGAYMAQLEFRQNSFSTYDKRVHFLPVWYPDGTYTVYTWLLDAWTPSGMLSMNLSDHVIIRGSLFDDWYTNRG